MEGAWELDENHYSSRAFTEEMAIIDWAQHESSSFSIQSTLPTPHFIKFGDEHVYVEEVVDASVLPETKSSYEAVCELGSGSFSTVYAVREKASKRCEQKCRDKKIKIDSG